MTTMVINRKHISQILEQVCEASEKLSAPIITGEDLFAAGASLASMGKYLTSMSGSAIHTEPQNVLLVKDAALLEALKQVLREYERACAKHPQWPVQNKAQGVCIVFEEVGELAQAVNDYLHGTETILIPMHQEAIQTVVTALRMTMAINTEIKERGGENA